MRIKQTARKRTEERGQASASDIADESSGGTNDIGFTHPDVSCEIIAVLEEREVVVEEEKDSFLINENVGFFCFF